uniref:Chitinase n=1 Tax=Alexandrium monilatum TaxID=311494 RepID=A0A7S4RXE5_9DINO
MVQPPRSREARGAKARPPACATGYRDPPDNNPLAGAAKHAADVYCPKLPRPGDCWNHAGPWCPPPGGWGHTPPFGDDAPLDDYLAYVRGGGSCKDDTGIKVGGWTLGCLQSRPRRLPCLRAGQRQLQGLRGDQGRGLDVQRRWLQREGVPRLAGAALRQAQRPHGRRGFCWWGRGVIQTTSTCNYGKLNYYMGKRAADEGRAAAFPHIDFCKDPGSICAPDGPRELKWVAGFFYWLNAVQPYASGGWTYLTKPKERVDGGMNLADRGFINGASGMVNRGCHNPPACNTGDLHGGGGARAELQEGPLRDGPARRLARGLRAARR